MSEITVKDHRLFDKDGNLRDQDQTEKAPLSPQPDLEPPKEAQAQPEGQKKDPAIDLGDLPTTIGVLFLDIATNALMQMGEKGVDGQSAPNAPNLPWAKRLIDLLGVLEKKTKGNLDREEEELLRALLYDVRLKYVALTSGSK
ncbi:MAG: DUF1844 domain-containing protein [Deltaproteobacteria bacterium]|jgi:hypothetical protein|nr:DUF1844 domain-containing protein [Deltaproteobacteria bacterium]